MSTWVKYSISFFVLVLILSALVFTFGPREQRDAFYRGESPVGQLPANQHIQSQGMGAGVSTTSDSDPSTGTVNGTTSAPVNAPIGDSNQSNQPPANGR